MGTKTLKRLLVIVAIIIISTTSIIVYKAISHSTIEHFKQYIVPCEGRIASYEDTNALLVFYVLDETSISEMADSKNIHAIHLVSENGEKIDAKEWEVSDGSGFYSGNKYSQKNLSVTISNSRSINFVSMEIVYSDKTETFDIGKLSVYSQTISNLEACTQISSQVWDDDPYKGIMNATVEKILYQETLLDFSAYSLGENINIDSIDLGIPGMGIDPSTIQEVSENTNIQQEITNQNPVYNKYTISNIIERMPEQTVNISISGADDSRRFLLGLRITAEYLNKPMVRYFSPIYYCTDQQTGEKYAYVNMNYLMVSSAITSDEYALKLLEENGQ